MTYLAIVLLAVVALAPLALMLGRPGASRGRRDSAMAIHRGQLLELDRDLADGRIAPAEHATARLELQRRLLAAGETAEPEPLRASPIPLYVALALVPALGVGLYLIDGRPGLPAAPYATRAAAADQDAQRAETLITQLRGKLATMDPTSDIARQGFVLLGNAEDGRGRLPEAAEAWRRALAIRFDAGLAALVAEAQSRLDGRVSPASADLFRRALAEGPKDAAWRKIAEARLAEPGKP